MIRTLTKAATWLFLSWILAACADMATPGGGDRPAGGASDSEEVPPTPPAPIPLPAVSLPDLGPAPDIANQEWLNTDRPLNLAALEGKVVLIEFWTFG